MPYINIINPASGESCGSYPMMEQPEVEQLIQDMHVVQQSWSQSPIPLRQQCLSKLAQLLRQHQDESATLMTNEMGKPRAQALAEVEKCARLCEYYAKEGPGFLEPEMIQTEFYKSYRAFQPLGIIFAIMPWNFPFWQVMRFAVPNLMVGNAGLLKHAPNSTGTALFIEQLILKAGFPKGLFRSLVIDVALSPFIIHHPQVMGVTLTGSNLAGKSVASEAGAALKKVVLELGGSDPYVILDDADIELAAEQCVLSRLSNAGQVCIAAKRMIVVESVKEAFTARVLEKAQSYVMGDPHLLETKLGPMAREDLRTKLIDQVERAIKGGDRCILGGKTPAGKGYYYPATVLVDVTENSPAFHEELFGPVICIIAAKDEKDAIRLANTTEFGLAGAIFTRDLVRGERLARESIESGSCAVNTLVASDPRLPFGGMKQSGYGRELSIEGMREFVNIKTVIVSK
ncbi:MAG: NAD-dependent succinate-semialdehyde dehydrogenase [Gammaproteobacteria bacterium]|nr:NAD-dependent succinate-semialdehyde dehydrogenase [Gammaproteobacteria bacterium]